MGFSLIAPARIMAVAVSSFFLATAAGQAAPEGGAAPQTQPASAAPTVSTVPTADQAGITWVRIPGGEFTMGSDPGEGDERPAHRVRIKDFFLAKSAVTQAQWLAVMGTAPSLVKNCDACPVTNVSWDEAQLFLEKAGKLTGARLRLPTEAEWEYAAGGGAQHQTWAGTSNYAEATEFGWFSINSARKPHPVCQKKPNLFGLCDMCGNTWEWCSDWYGQPYYRESPEDNPTGPAAGENRVLRGGCYTSPITNSRVAIRYNSWPGAQTPYNSFRPAKDY